MGIQINGSNDTISAADGGLSISGQSIDNANLNLSQNLSVSGIGTVTNLRATNVSVTGITTVAAGSASAPSITPTGDSNTGIFFPALDYVSVATNGTEQIRVDSSGNVNIDSGTVYVDAVNNRLAIGTTTPVQPLEVVTATGGGIAIRPNAGNATQGLLFYDTGGGPYGFVKYDHQASAMFFGTNTTERARITSDGKLLVGTSTSLSLDGLGSNLQVEGTTFAASQSIVRHGGVPAFRFGRSGGSSLGSTTLVANGDDLGVIRFIGADGSDFDSIAAEIKAQVDGTPGSNDMPGRLVFSTTADGASSPTERMRITSAGALSLPPCNGADLVGTEACGFVGDSTFAPIFKVKSALTSTKNCAVFVNGNGQVGSIQMNGSATNYNTSSDYRLKENITPLTGAADRLSQLQVHRFNFIADPDKTVDGFLAHEAQAVVPECVTGTKDEVDDEGNPAYQGIDQSKLVPLLTAALQEAIGRIETLEAEVAALKGA